MSIQCGSRDMDIRISSPTVARLMALRLYVGTVTRGRPSAGNCTADYDSIGNKAISLVAVQEGVPQVNVLMAGSAVWLVRCWFLWDQWYAHVS